MALQHDIPLLTLAASGDLSTKQYYLVKIDSNGQVAVAGAGEAAIGVLQTKPSAQGDVCSVAPLIGTKLIALAGGSFSPGAFLAANASGKLVSATKGKVDTSDAGAAADPLIGSHVVGIALETGADGSYVQFMAIALGAVPTTAA